MVLPLRLCVELVLNTLSLPLRQSLFYFCGAGKFCLAHGLRQLIRDVRTINFRSDVTYATL